MSARAYENWAGKPKAFSWALGPSLARFLLHARACSSSLLRAEHSSRWMARSSIWSTFAGGEEV